jgi:hypothetical protein
MPGCRPARNRLSGAAFDYIYMTCIDVIRHPSDVAEQVGAPCAGSTPRVVSNSHLFADGAAATAAYQEHTFPMHATPSRVACAFMHRFVRAHADIKRCRLQHQTCPMPTAPQALNIHAATDIYENHDRTPSIHAQSP